MWIGTRPFLQQMSALITVSILTNPSSYKCTFRRASALAIGLLNMGHGQPHSRGFFSLKGQPKNVIWMCSMNLWKLCKVMMTSGGPNSICFLLPLHSLHSLAEVLKFPQVHIEYYRFDGDEKYFKILVELRVKMICFDKVYEWISINMTKLITQIGWVSPHILKSCKTCLLRYWWQHFKHREAMCQVLNSSWFWVISLIMIKCIHVLSFAC